MPTTFDQAALNAILDALPGAAFVLDADGTISTANTAASILFDMDLAGRHLSMVMRAPATLEAFEQVVAHQRPCSARNETHGRFAMTIDVHFAVLGQYYLATCIDVTREQNIERMRSDFVANASHELRTPLTTLSGFIDTMQGAARQDEKARSTFLQMMRAQADRMARLINDLLSLSRIELDEHVAPEGKADLSSIAAQSENLLRALAAETRCSVVLDLPDRLMVQGDASQLTQVVHNLMENALKYAGDGKTVRVEGRVEHDHAVLRVIDNGPGIASHHVPRLTERFYRVNVQASRTRGGTGLGLAICKHIINRHRGRLVIESEPGRGSSFAIHMPRSK